MSLVRGVNRLVVALFSAVFLLLIWSQNAAFSAGRLPQFFSFGSATGGSPFLSLREEIPETTYIKGLAGFNYFHNLYFVSGAFVVVTSTPSDFPQQGVGYILSGAPRPDDGGMDSVIAGPDRWRMVTPEQAEGLLGGVAVKKTGISIFFNDASGPMTGGFLNHYFHCEVFLGAWRLISSAGETEFPARMMYRTIPEDWRDSAGLTAWFQQSIMPTTAIEEGSIFEDRAKGGMTFVYDRIAIIDRWAAHRHGVETAPWNKATGDLPSLEASKDWMEPLRQSLKRLVLADGCKMQRNKPLVPVVTYINRQLTGRRLVTADHEALVEAMYDLDEQGLIEFVDARMETMSRTRQFCAALRSDIMIGVHGNGLSHQLWMKPGSGVLEFMDVGGFARDYGILSELMGHEYYVIHRDAILPPDKWRGPDGWSIGTTPGFHGPNIRLDAEFISGLIKRMARDRLHVREPALAS